MSIKYNIYLGMSIAFMECSQLSAACTVAHGLNYVAYRFLKNVAFSSLNSLTDAENCVRQTVFLYEKIYI